MSSRLELLIANVRKKLNEATDVSRRQFMAGLGAAAVGSAVILKTQRGAETRQLIARQMGDEDEQEQQGDENTQKKKPNRVLDFFSKKKQDVTSNKMRIHSLGKKTDAVIGIRGHFEPEGELV